MVQLLVDENFNQRILRGLKRRLPALDCLLAQETEVFQKDDPQVLDWAAAHNRVIVTHDANTMTKHAYERLEAGQPLPGSARV
jgi:predicted nuclease of predicted toxin-antitoxin system